jgi:hypothetical protein
MYSIISTNVIDFHPKLFNTPYPNGRLRAPALLSVQFEPPGYRKSGLVPGFLSE